MHRRARAMYRAQRSPLFVPTPWVRSVTVVTGVGAVIAALILKYGKTGLTAAPPWIRYGLGARPYCWLWAALVAGLLVWVCWSLFRWSMVRRPGPVDVPELTFAESSIDTDDSAPALTAELRQRLVATQLYQPSAGPVEAPPRSFVEALTGTGPMPEQAFGAALRAAARLSVPTAYRVSGVLRHRPEAPRYGLTATVTAFYGLRSTMTTIWRDSWDEAVQAAAYWALAAILPATRLAKHTPLWRHWYKRQLPDELFAAYTKAKVYQDNRQFDQAILQYQVAIGQDPCNPYLRFALAGVQEELGLFLDALETYHGALTIGQEESTYDEHLWSRRRDRILHPIAKIWRNYMYYRRRPDALLLRYRYAWTLLYAERTAAQWVRGAGERDTGDRRVGHDGRTRAKIDIRQRLRPMLVARYWRAVAGVAPGYTEAQLKAWLDQVLRSNDELLVALVFQLGGNHEMYRLREDYWYAQFVPKARAFLTSSTLDLCRELNAPLRLAETWHRWRRNASAPSLDGTCDARANPLSRNALGHWWRRRVRERAAAVVDGWPLTAGEVDSAIRNIDHGDYANLYNAACAFAFAMRGYARRDDQVTARRWRFLAAGRRVAVIGRVRARPGSAGAWSDRSSDLANRAVRYLRRAIASAESGYVTTKRSWILSIDPGLVELRYRSEFGRFEMQCLPGGTQSRPRPDKVVALCMSAYGRALMTAGALALERVWHERARSPSDTGIHTITAWLQHEQNTWNAVAAIADARSRHAPDRAMFAECVLAVKPQSIATNDFPPAVPQFDAVLDEQPDDLARIAFGPDGCDCRDRIDAAANQRVRLIDEEWPAIGTSARVNANLVRELLDELRQRDRDGQVIVPATTLIEWCQARAAAWQALAAHIDLKTRAQSGRASSNGVAAIRGRARYATRPPAA